MGIKDFFKRRKTTLPEDKKTADAEIKIREVKTEKETEKETVKTKVQTRPTTRTKEAKINQAFRLLKIPQVTEKATDLTKRNQYVFKVFPQANKVEVKKTIEELYGVDVLNVKIIKVPAKKRKLGRIKGWRKGYKKAIVRIKEGQKIEVLPR